MDFSLILLSVLVMSYFCMSVYADLDESTNSSSSVSGKDNQSFNLTNYNNNVALDQQALDFYNQGYEFFSQGKYKEAIVYFDQALEIYPNQTLYLLKKGDSLFNIAQYEEALGVYEHAYAAALGGNPKKLSQDGIAKVNQKIDQLKNLNKESKNADSTLTIPANNPSVQPDFFKMQDILPGFKTQYISRHINETDGQPYELSALFNWSDNNVENRVYSSLQFEPLKKATNFEWLCYDPTGKMALSTKNYRKAGSTFAYAFLKARNQRIGEWTVKVKMDDVLIDSDTFSINNNNPSQSIDCLGNTVCGDKCCMGGNYGCCHTIDGDKCYNLDVTICIPDQYDLSKITSKY